MGWLTGWNYRKSHVINAQAGAGTDYQKRIVVYYGAGVDSGEDVYLDSKCRTDFGDVRFTDDDGSTELDYWMESKTDSDNAVFWVEVKDDLSTNAQTIYVYYGKADATTTSNGTNTFLVFDEFGSDLWDNLGGATHNVSGGQMTCDSTSADGIVKREIVCPDGIAFWWTIKSWENAAAWFCSVIANDGTNVVSGYLITGGTSDCVLYKASGGSWVAAGDFYFDGGESPVVDKVVEIRRYGGNTVQLLFNGVSKGTITDSSITTGGRVGFRQILTTRGKTVDDVRARKYVSPEPSHGSWGSEETPPVTAAPSGSVIPILLEGVGII